MARVLFINGGLEGHVNPTIALVEELLHRGEEVIYMTTEAFRDRLEALGASVITFDGAQFTAAMRAGEVNNLVGVATGLLRTADIVIPRALEQIGNGRIDYIIHDSMLGSGRILAQILGKPAITSSSTFARSEATVNRMLQDWSQRTSKEAYEKSLEAFFKVARTVQSTYNVAVGSVYEAYCNPEPLTLVYTSRYFQPEGDHFDETYQFVGPTIRSSDEEWNFSDLDLTAKPLIYIAFGTLFNQAIDFYRLAFAAFADRPYTIILSVGRQTSIADLGEIPPNFIVRNYVPQVSVLERASLFITHGGMNSTNEGLYHGVPLMVFPQGADQHQVARRIEELRVGAYIQQEGLTAITLREAVDGLINNLEVRRQCGRVAESFRGAMGVVRAVDEIFSYVKDRRESVP